MALNIKNPRVERLAAEVAKLARESKTEAIGRALEERKARLALEPRSFLERFLTDWNVSVVPFGEDHWKMAIEAHARFGRGHHKAALNFGDCLSYATAKLADMPLLCTGRDFSKTDLAMG